MSQAVVYLLDDEPELVELLAEITELAGFPARGFTSGETLFSEAGDFEPGSILVLDLQMPGMDGIEVMRRLAGRQDPPSLILISGHDIGVLHAAEKLGRAQNLEILATLDKPVKLQAYRNLLDRHLSRGSGRLGRRDPAHRPKPRLEELSDGIRNGGLRLQYEPQLEIATGRLAGVEALVRWQHPELGLVFPDDFIGLAERNGLIGELTHWVISNAVRQEQQWQAAGLSVNVSVNISAADITSLTLPEQLAELLGGNRLDPTKLTLEVTESALMGELVTSLDILTRLRLKGIGLSIDDFGTGYSSLSQLHRVPFTELKIDRSFVGNMVEDSEARAIVKTCILLGHELDMRVVAEGVESQAIWDLLAEFGCDLAQGYHLAHSMSGEALFAWVGEQGLSRG